MTENVPETAGPRGRRFGCLLSLLCGFAIIASAILLTYFIWYSNARSQLDAEIARIESRGEPLWFKDMAPRVDDAQEDGTSLYMQALAKMNSPSAALAKLMTAESSDPPSEDPLIIAELARNREVLDLLAQATSKPNFRLPIDYETTQPFGIQLDATQGARDLARLLASDVTAALAAGDHARAIETTGRMFDLSELLRNEPFTITQLVRIAIGSMAQSSLKQAMANVDLTPQQFDELDEKLAKIDSEFTLAPAMMAERASAFTTMNNLRENMQILKESSDPPTSLGLWGAGPLHPNMMADQACMLHIMTDVIDAIDRPGQEGSDMMHDIESRIQNLPNRYVYTRLLAPALVNIRAAGLRYRQQLITARLGIRVDRYFAEHGRFPASLSEIVDERLPAVPSDLFAGKAHVYRVLADGFVIYSVGPNGIDDGGGKQPDQLEFYTAFDVHYPQLAPATDGANEDSK